MKKGNTWFFDVVSESGYRYDASVFPAHHGHGGFVGIDPAPHTIPTPGGPLVEIPISTVSVLGRRFCFFGGGYLRLSPLPVIRWGVRSCGKSKEAADRLRAPPGDRSRSSASASGAVAEFQVLQQPGDDISQAQVAV